MSDCGDCDCDGGDSGGTCCDCGSGGSSDTGCCVGTNETLNGNTVHTQS